MSDLKLSAHGIDKTFKSDDLDAMLTWFAEENITDWTPDGRTVIAVHRDGGDIKRDEVLAAVRAVYDLKDEGT